MPNPMDGRSTHVRGTGNTSRGGMTTQSHSGSGSGMTGTGATSASGTGLNGTGTGSGRSSGGNQNYGGRSSGGGGFGPIPEMAKKLAHMEARLSTMEMGARAGQMSFTSLYDGDLKAYNLLGELKMKIGKQNDGKYGVVYVNGTAPSTPTKPLVSARQLYIVVGWDGEFEEGFDKPSDFARVDVHLSTAGEDFVPTGVTSVGSIYAEGNIAIPADIQDFYIKLVAVTQSDVPSSPSAVEIVRPFPATAIAAESIAAVHLASEISLSSTFIAGDPTGAHLEMNASGIAMFRADQTPTVMFSTDEGNALITGSIQTALSGSGKARIVFNTFPDQDWNEIRFFAPGDKSWSSLFASRDREGRDGAIALQGYITDAKPFAMMTVLGEDSILTGVFRRDANLPNGQSPFTDGMLASPLQTLMIAGGGPSLIHNYKRATPASNADPSTYYPFVAFIDTADGIVHGQSVVEFCEYYSPNANVRLPYWRCSFADLGLDWGDEFGSALAVKNYQLTEYQPVGASMFKVFSSRAGKKEIEPLGDHVDILSAISAVEPKRYRRQPLAPVEDEDDTLWVPDIHPPDLTPVAAENPISAQKITEARKRKRADGKIPNGKRPPRKEALPEYGLVAEEVREVAPDAVVEDGSGRPMLNLSAVLGLTWGGIRDLAARVAALEEQMATEGDT